MTGRRTSLWADVVVNLAAVAGLTIVLNAVLLGFVAQGREAELRRGLAQQLSRDLALRASALALTEGLTDLRQVQALPQRFGQTDLPGSVPFLAVVATPSLEPLVARGRWPRSLRPDASAEQLLELRRQWLVEGIDAREALAGRRTVAGEWRPRASFFARSWAVASSPVSGRQNDVLGIVRVALPIGRSAAGPLDKSSLPVLAFSVLASAAAVAAFGWLLFRRRVLAPIERLLESTQELGRGRFDIRIPQPAQDELGDLAGAFNRLAARLQESQLRNDAQLAELRAANEDLSQAREDLIFAEKMASVGRLAAGFAHEVGNPLASVIGFAELLEQNPDDAELAADLLPRIRAELDRIHRIIRDLLGYARPSAPSHASLPPVAPEQASDLAAVLDASRNLVLAQRRFSGVSFEFALPARLPPTSFPRDNLQQVILNLFVNAAEAMDGQGTIHVRPAPPDDPGFFTLAVADEGPGIDPRLGSNIFEPFFTTKDVGQGTGLGLAVSLRLVERFGGALRHQRNHHGGACFHLTLPIAEGPR